MKIKLVSIEQDGVLRVAADGAITSDDFPADRRNPLEEVIGSSWSSSRVLLDFSSASYIDSTAIGWLLSSHKKMKSSGGMLVLHSVPGSVRQIFSLLKIGSVVPIATNDAEAVEMVKSASAPAADAPAGEAEAPAEATESDPGGDEPKSSGGGDE